MPMNIVLLEDEPLVARNLEQLLNVVAPDASIIATLAGVTQAKKWFIEHTAPDLIISDIRLSDGLSFEIFDAIPLACPIIFTTAFDEYAIRAFKLNSIDYLLKPVDEEELQHAIQKFQSRSNSIHLTEQIRHALEALNHPEKKYKVRFLAMYRNALVPVGQEQVALFHKEELIYLHTLQGEKLISEHQTLDELEELVDPTVFFRVNRQNIIHLQAVAQVKTTHKGLSVQVKLSGIPDIEISREKASAFKRWLGQ